MIVRKRRTHILKFSVLTLLKSLIYSLLPAATECIFSLIKKKKKSNRATEELEASYRLLILNDQKVN